ncbi:MAG: rhomboid family intramembrane serine protease [Phocaeicola sp.]|nr:rhomboid family intramembrane serine protease [Phocaeicola sp.]MDD7447971.1 rhomboid family intramembrane serine protease [Prevotellaceae bacterium]MDY3915078.1 rhomboid family intramembrane serine protease [Phocaeicola sp.]MDY5939919.1 rhomboid family intramembrane serine protease [Phocaeicola sp.]
MQFQSIPAVTKNLLIINALCFLGSLAAERSGVDLGQLLGLHIYTATDFKFYQFFTYMFMHAGFEHLFFNMFALFMFGPALERIWGTRRFLIFYLVCGIGAGLVQEVVQLIYYGQLLSGYDWINTGESLVSKADFLNEIYTVGASGAVYGILLAFGMTYPNAPLFIFPFPFPIKTKYYIMGLVVLEIVLGLSMRDSVAHTAHLGGMFFAGVMIYLWRKKNGYSAF